MKMLSFILILIYLSLPALCFGHPCAHPLAPGTNASQQATLSAMDECPFSHEDDFCESTCCCADYLPEQSFIPSKPALAGAVPPLEHYRELPDLIYRIFIPPRIQSFFS